MPRTPPARSTPPPAAPAVNTAVRLPAALLAEIDAWATAHAPPGVLATRSWSLRALLVAGLAAVRRQEDVRPVAPAAPPAGSPR